MAEIDKLTLEIESKASQSTKGIDELINRLQKLDTVINTSVSKLNRLSSSFAKLESATKGLRNINFNNLNNSIGQLSTAFNKIEKATQNFESTAQSIKTMSSAMNSLMRSLNKMSAGQANIGNIDLSKLISQINNISKLGTVSQSLLQLKDGAKAINTLVKSLENLNKLDFKTTRNSINQLIKLLNSMVSASKNFVTASQNIKLMASALNSLNKAIAKLNTTQTASNLNLNNLNLRVSQYTKGMKQGSTFSGATDILSMTMLLRQAGDAFGYLLNKSNDYIETMNLFTVVMGSATEQAWDFIQALETIGVDQEQAMRYQSSFYDIGKSLGMTAENAYTLSEQFTKLSYDYASLYNLPIEDSFQKLQAAIVGTTEPIRRLGKDISIAKLEEVALSLGIQESVRNMTQAEKAELRFIAVMQQSSAAMNDMERTIDQPANALRVLKAQFTSLARELGNIFIPILQAVLPWLIAITKFIRGVIADIAGFFGISFNEIDWSGINSELGTSDAYTNDVADNLGDAASNAKELKDYMLGIDELNVLNEDTGSIDRNTGAAGAGGVGGGGGLGLDLSEFGYDEILKQVNSEAEEILKTLEKWKVPLLTAAGILATMFVGNKIAKFMNNLSFMTSILSGLGGAFTSLGMTVLGTTTPSFAALGAGLATVALVMASIAGVAYTVYQAFQPVTKEVDVFGSGISDITENKLKPFVEEWNNLGYQLDKIEWTDKVITDEDVNTIMSSVNYLVSSIYEEIENDKEQYLSDIELLDGVEGISEETKAQMIANNDAYYDTIKQRTEDAQKEIQQILESANGNEAALTEEQRKRLAELREQMKNDAVSIMTESADEQELILARLNANVEAMSLENASKVLQDAKKSKDETIVNAEEQRDALLLTLQNQYDEGIITTKKEYEKQRKAVIKAYKQQVKDAEDNYDKIESKVKKGLGNVSDQIDYETGEIKKNWQIWWEDLQKDPAGFFGNVINTITTGMASIGSTVLSELGKIASGIPDAIKGILSSVSSLLQGWSLGDLVGWLVDTGVNILGYLWDHKGDIVSWVADLGASVLSGLGDLGLSILGWLGNSIADIFTSLAGVVSDISTWINDLGTKMGKWLSDNIGKVWDGFWGGLKTFFQGVIDGLADWWNSIKTTFNSWKEDFKDAWDDFWGGLGKYKDQFKLTDPSTWISWSSMTVPIDYAVGSVAAPEVTAFARGGFVPANASFASPSMSLWTAGEAGRELVGSYKGKTTVMPLEDTGFVQAIYESTRDAVISAMNQVQATTAGPMEVRVYLDSREIRKANVKQEAVQSNPFVTRR